VDSAELTEQMPEELSSGRFTRLVKQVAERGITHTPNGKRITTAPGMLTVEDPTAEARYQRFWVSNGELLSASGDDVATLDQAVGDELSPPERLGIFDVVVSTLSYEETHQGINSLH
jgi:hypothetical protein